MKELLSKDNKIHTSLTYIYILYTLYYIHSLLDTYIHIYNIIYIYIYIYKYTYTQCALGYQPPPPSRPSYLVIFPLYIGILVSHKLYLLLNTSNFSLLLI